MILHEKQTAKYRNIRDEHEEERTPRIIGIDHNESGGIHEEEKQFKTELLYLEMESNRNITESAK